MNSKPKTVSCWILACFFILAGWNHFRDPALYLSMMPPSLPRPELLNAVSGLAEIAGGMGVLIPRLRRPAAWGLIALLVAIFPANIHVAMNGWAGANLAPWALWLRLPFQLLFIGGVYWACLAQAPSKLTQTTS